MIIIAFNTHNYIKRLVKQGMSEELAEEVANGLTESRQFDLDNFVTKDYLDMKLKAELSQLKYDLLKWILGIYVGGFSIMTSIIIAVLKFYLDK